MGTRCSSAVKLVEKMKMTKRPEVHILVGANKDLFYQKSVPRGASVAHW
jgi:hypothetical protein